MKIAVLMGGISGERGVSLASGIQVVVALREAGHDVVGIDTSEGVLSGEGEAALLASGIDRSVRPAGDHDLLRTGEIRALLADPRVRDVDVFFPALHGEGGEDGTVQTLLELAGVPFAGSDRVGCTLSMDKDISKRLLAAAGVATPDWVTVMGRVEAESRLDEVVERLGLPLVVKPPSGGSTLGLSLAHDREELDRALSQALAYESTVLFEAYVRGREVTVGILGDRALPVGEIIPQHELFDYECKYEPGMAQEIFPADLSGDLARSLGDQALLTHATLRLQDFSRVDFIVDQAGLPWCLEANALPGLTKNSLLPKAAQAAGITFPELCDRIARMAWERGPR